jgi:hypothetical protein
VETQLATANEIAERRYECSFEAIERWDGRTQFTPAVADDMDVSMRHTS